MQRGTIVLIIFVLAAAGLIGLSQVLQNQPPLNLTLAVDPLIEPWAREVITAFNEGSNTRVGTGRQVQFSLQSIDDTQVWNVSSNTGANTAPRFDAWVPASSASVQYAISRNLPLKTVKNTLAQTPLMLGGFASNVSVLTDALSWQTLADIAAKDQRIPALNNAFLNVAFPLPNQTMTGLAVLLNVAADHHQTTTLASAQLSDSSFRNRLMPIIRSVSNFNTIGGDAALYLTRGSNAAHVVIATESQWLKNLDALTKHGSLHLVYPAPAVVFDFPLAVWQTSETPEEHQQAVNALGEWLIGEQAQRTLKRHGLRPINSAITLDDALFVAGEAHGIQLTPVLEPSVTLPPNLTDIQGLLRWFETARR